ncbi:hypothetical protein RF11_02020 [Thelohanellus kitauei]|uniref:Tc1-like transposase DDE domain-containing protein n=1 Tax=Thelohanellus kitauei TaxID=669202 RepID=A0A0C2JFH8_THEKT|nr:hypothetical protein RF11_02020 [Thelohanellus kitauei]
MLDVSLRLSCIINNTGFGLCGTPKNMIRANQTVPNELRSLIIAPLNNGKNFTEIKTLFNVSVPTARKINKIYQREGGIKKLQDSGYHRANLTDEQKESLCDILEEDCSRTIQIICDLFFERYNIRIGRSTATRCFKDFHYTLKLVRPFPERRNDPQNILARKEYAINFLRIAPDRQKVFFIDETGFQVNMICRYGRELTGVVPALRSRNYSVACTMSCEGMVNFKISERAY